MRVMKPGAHLVACGAPRSSHRMVCGLEDAGFEIRDSLAWLFGQGFPKSLNLDDDLDGLGTALKPGHEPICLARKPIAGTIEENIRVWGVGALNIDRARLGDGDRWPANVLLDQQAGVLLDQQAGVLQSGANPTRRGSDKFRKVFGKFKGERACIPARGADSGGASRFYFVAKPSRFERDFGCDDLPLKSAGEMTDRKDGTAGLKSPRAGAGRTGGGRNPHPTVKPVSLMQWLLWLIAPPGCVVLDLFLGSGTTGMAAVADGYRFIGIERELEYLTTADARIAHTLREKEATA
jgi:site-specific DNA-methyltransferase (adenine-specific)